MKLPHFLFVHFGVIPSPERQQARAVGDRGSDRVRSHHNWGVRLGRRREEIISRTEPVTLGELEELARRSVELMEKYTPKSEHNYSMAMDLLRQQYNLNFMILCDECRGLHNHDEILAPER